MVYYLEVVSRVVLAGVEGLIVVQVEASRQPSEPWVRGYRRLRRVAVSLGTATNGPTHWPLYLRVGMRAAALYCCYVAVLLPLSCSPLRPPSTTEPHSGAKDQHT